MFGWFLHLFDTSGFPPRWQCGSGWAEEPILGWLHIFSDLGTFAAYFAVPCVVAFYVAKTPGLWAKFPKLFWVFLALVFFSCGTVHLIEAGIFYWPHYRLSAVFKVLTASVSLVGVYVLARSLPYALRLRTPDELQAEIDERQQAEAQLQFEKNLVHTLMNHLPDAIYFKDLSGKYLRVSRSLARSLDLESPNAAIGKSESDFWPQGKEFEKHDREVLRSGEAIIGQVEVAPWDEQRKTWLSTSRLPLYGPDQSPIGTFGIAHDITPIKQTEQRLATLTRRLAFPRESAPTHLSPIRMREFRLEDMITCGSDIRAMGLKFQGVRELEQNIVEYLYRRLQDDEGNSAPVLVRMFQTERFRNLEPELQQIAQELVTDHQLQPDTCCLVLKGSAGADPSWNDPSRSKGHRVIPLPSVGAVERLPMLTRLMQQLGVDIGGLLEGQGRLLIDDSATSVFHVADARGSEFIPDQESFVIPHGVQSVVGFGDVLPSGDLFAVICFSRVPISHQIAVLFSHLSISAKLALLAIEPPGQRVESQIQAVDTLLENYERVVCDQESVIQQTMTELKDARDAADEANRIKSDFLANMSHEIRTPMNAIIGMTELVLEGELKPSERDYLTTVLDSAEALLNIINEILDFSKIEAGKLEIHYVEFDVREEVGDMVRSLGIRAHRKGIELAYQIDPEIPDRLVCDVARLRQVIVNLTGNAIKFTDKGEVVVLVEAVDVQSDNATIQFRVVDTGMGIPPHQQDSIFDAFAQADGSTTRAHGGTGLGLSISATIVRRLGGKIDVKSEVGQGSEFSFVLKVPIGRGEPSRRPHPDELQGMPALLVDDNTTNLHILQRMVGAWGMQPLGASSGAQALEVLDHWDTSQRPLPIVISDVHMPRMDGYDLIEKIRNHPTASEVSVIVLTSGARPGDLTRCQQLGVVSHLMKPVKETELVNALLDARGVHTGSRSGAERTVADDETETKPLNILLAEDGIANQKLAIAMLQRWGHHTAVASNGAIAVEMYRAGNYDLILMDLQMPVMDGLDATKKIRSMEVKSGGHIPIIAMTAHAMVGDRKRCLEAGMDHYISKPIHKDKLAEALAIFDPSNREIETSPTTMNTQPDPDSRPKSTHSVDAESSEAEIDLSGPLEVMEGQVDILVSVVEAFLEEAPELMKQLDQALIDGDAKVVERAAHTIKGGFRILQLDDEIEAWANIETIAREGKLDDVRQIIDETKQSSDRRLQQLQQFVDQNQDSSGD